MPSNVIVFPNPVNGRASEGDCSATCFQVWVLSEKVLTAMLKTPVVLKNSCSVIVRVHNCLVAHALSTSWGVDDSQFVYICSTVCGSSRALIKHICNITASRIMPRRGGPRGTCTACKSWYTDSTWWEDNNNWLPSQDSSNWKYKIQYANAYSDV